MNKRSLMLVLLAAMLVIGASKPVKTVRLTLINKSGKEIEVSLSGADFETSYFFRVGEGSRSMPVEKAYDILPDRYQVKVHFSELWDPVYGVRCQDRSQAIEIRHVTRVIVFECDITPPNGGEPGRIKLGGQNASRRPR